VSARRDEVAAVCGRVLAALDWRALGDVYFHDGGEPDLRARRRDLVRLGLEFARELLRRVPRGGASLWVGAGLGELPVLLAETMSGGRGVLALNLRAEECRLLNAALLEGAPELGIEYVAADARQAAGARTFDHVGCVSVFTDPETWPLLSAVAYGRLAPVQLDVEAFVAEREQARVLAARLFERLQLPGLISTTAEEAPWFLEQAMLAGAGFDADERLFATALVGDPVGFLRLG
jgi:hypothetical protein